MKWKFSVSFLLLAAFFFTSLGRTPALAQINNCGSTFTAQSGDFFTKIAQQCGVSYSALLAANPQDFQPNLTYVLRQPEGQSLWCSIVKYGHETKPSRSDKIIHKNY